MTSYLEAEPLFEAGAELGEGPCWDAELGLLSWVDILAGRVHLLASDGTPRGTHEVDTHVGAALPAAGGGWLLAVREGFAKLSAAGVVSPVCSVQADRPELRFNDAKVDPFGRAFAGTMAYDTRPGAATLYRLDRGPHATVIMDGRTLCNGLGWSPDGSRFYFVDSPTQRVTVHDYDVTTGEVGEGALLVEIPKAAGMPDGMCVDDDGGLWVALWGGGAVHRYTPAGELDAVVRLPVSRPTSCAFGQDVLYVTSARTELASPEPLAGAVFACRPGATGPAATPWREV